MIRRKEQIACMESEISELQSENTLLKKQLQGLKKMTTDMQSALEEQQNTIIEMKKADEKLLSSATEKCTELNRKVGSTDEWLKNTRQYMWDIKEEISRLKKFGKMSLLL